MPFKWRPFDLYNDIHINRATGDNVCETASTCSNCIQCQSNCDPYLVLWSNFRKLRKNSRGSSSASSCTSLSTTSHFTPDVETASGMSTIKSNGSFEYYRKLLGQSDSKRDKFRCAHHQQYQRTDPCACYGATVNCRCGSSCRNIMRNRATIHNTDDLNCKNVNCVLAVSVKRTEQMSKPHQMTLSSNGCEASSKYINAQSTGSDKIRTNECNKRKCNSDYTDKWQYSDNNASTFNKLLADSKLRLCVKILFQNADYQISIHEIYHFVLVKLVYIDLASDFI